MTVLTPNPAIDITYRVSRQRIGSTVRVLEVLRRAGGKGINVARVLRSLGIEVAAVQPLGGAAGEWIHTRLLAEGISAHSIPITEQTRSTVTVVDDVEHPTVLAEPGPHVPEEAWARLCERVRLTCHDGGILVISGSLPPGAAPARISDLIAAGRGAGARVIVDVSGPALLAAAAAGADLLKPNAEEALQATGAQQVDAAIAQLLHAGARSIVLSQGRGGLLAVDSHGRRLHQGAVPDVTGNPTGAGDAATAGIAVAWARGAALPVALHWASLLGAAAVLRPSAGEIDLADLSSLAERLPTPPSTSPASSLPAPIPAPMPTHPLEGPLAGPAAG
ncbi:hexose kinase [Kineococcus sp. T13]|uniref:hexose kinase n=1 Tax=Kineococcus vitellinus TaxID=2696565 RepID=UPI0014131313|nr:hexose kinase [Kineococcus vitellinus]